MQFSEKAKNGYQNFFETSLLVREIWQVSKTKLLSSLPFTYFLLISFSHNFSSTRNCFSTFFQSESSACFVAQCFKKVSAEKNTAFGHNSQKWHPSVSLCTNTLCFLNSQWLQICFWQMSQITGWWVFLICSFLVLELTKLLLQYSHSKGLLFSWSLLIWSCIPCLVWNCFLQMWHLEFLAVFRQVCRDSYPTLHFLQ